MVKAKEKSVKHWTAKIDKAKKSLHEYFDQAQKAADAARDTGDIDNTFNIQWTNTQILRSAIYASLPKPDVRRRFQKPDKDEKQLAQMVERAIEYSIDSGNFDVPSRMVVRDYVEAGLGVCRVVYDVQTEQVPDPREIQTEPTYELGLTQIASQTIGIDHVPWNHFLWEPGKAWDDVQWIAFKSFKPKHEVEDEYGIILNGGPDNADKKRASEEFTNEIILWEIWDKPAKKVYVITPNHDKPLDVYDDPLKLQRFFPAPQPLMSNTKHDELIPKPDYCFIENQVRELNRLTSRILSLTKQIRDIAFYDKSLGEELSAAMTKEDGSIIPVNPIVSANLANMSAAISHLPMAEKIAVIRELEGQRENVKQQIYEIVGISDIVRGASEASETATAQQIKGQWANVRLSEKSSDVARIWRATFRLFAEIICEHFDPMQLYLMTGIEVTPPMQEFMQNDVGRSFAIDIETDSTIARDDHENKQQTIEMINVMVEKMTQLIPAVQNGALPVTVVQEILLMLVNTNKHGKQLEDSIHEIGPHLQGMQQFQQQMEQLQQQLMQGQQQLEQAGQENQQMGQQLQQFNEREEARKDAETRARIQREQVEIEAQAIENKIVASGVGLQEMVANVDQTRAETDKIRKETAYVGAPVMRAA